LGPTVSVGSNVTLRSLLPGSTSTVRVSGFQLGSGTETTTVYEPTGRTILIGVTLPVSFPLTETLAPVGDEVTFNTPFCAAALPGISKSAPHNAVIKTILAIQTALLGRFIESSLNASHRSPLCANLRRISPQLHGNTYVKSRQLPRHLPHLTQAICFPQIWVQLYRAIDTYHQFQLRNAIIERHHSSIKSREI
jgi:hypothetical protein